MEHDILIPQPQADMLLLEAAERESQIDAESPTEDICEETDEEAAENGFVGECEGDNGNDEETEDEDESEGFGMTM